MKNLSLHNLSNLDHLVYPDTNHGVTMASPATSVMIDFNYERPHIVDSRLSAIEANRLMMKIHTNVALVANEDCEFIGVISSRILTERSIIRLVANGMARDDVNVTEVMLPRDAIKAIDMRRMQTSTVKDVVTVLQDSSEEYCLVVESDTHLIRGMFSISDIARRLHTPILIRRKHTFVDNTFAMAH